MTRYERREHALMALLELHVACARAANAEVLAFSSSALAGLNLHDAAERLDRAADELRRCRELEETNG